MQLTATEILGAFQLGLISGKEAREKLGFAINNEEENE